MRYKQVETQGALRIKLQFAEMWDLGALCMGFTTRSALLDLLSEFCLNLSIGPRR